MSEVGFKHADAGRKSFLLVSVKRGTLHGVALGDPARKVTRIFGKSTGAHGGYRPVGERFTGPQALPGVGDVFRYRDYAFLVSDELGVYSMMTTDDQAQTERRVGVGDSLAAIRKAYPRARCGRYDYGEGDGGYAWCRLQVGRKSVFFGGDPVKSITITSFPH